MKPYVIGIDMGGTNTAFGIVDARGTVIASSSIKTGKHSKIEDYIDELYTEISRIIAANDAEGKINGIGIGAPNANYFTGVIEDGVNLPWPTPIPLADLISKKFGIPCLITNDANAAAIGEMTYGAARGLKDFIMITLGTGVGRLAASRPIARLQVWHAQLVSSSRFVTTNLYLGNTTSRTSHLKTCMTALSRATSWHSISSITLELS